MKWRWTGIILVTLLPVCLKAQSQDNRRTIWLLTGVAIVPDSMVIDPSSIRSLSISDTSLVFNYDHDLHKISIDMDGTNIPDSLLVQFRVAEFSQKSYARRSLTEYDSAALPKDYYLLGKSLPKERQQLFETGNVMTSGRLSRGITVGNTRDLLVNSSLNLTLDGQLTDDLFIKASITDQNIPYQPEGNTAQLQDFDNVFMKIYNKNFSVTAGDILMQNSPSHFLRFYKNVQGSVFKYNTEKTAVNVGASLAKGKFGSVQLKAIDGIGGPYRIRGPQGQNFVVVLANSEKVFLDGKLMKRGFNNDYVIDYNLGELTFNTGVLITRYSRIRVDYEYADTRYDRSILTAGYSRKLTNGYVYVQAYSEKDNKTSPNFDLSQEDFSILQSAGDNPLKAVIPSADSVGFDSDKILYKKEFIEGQEVFTYSTSPDSAFYEVKFSRIGPGLGNYIQTSTFANGRVYEWIAPIAGVLQGEYEPYLVIPAPSKKQMVVLGAKLELNSHESISFETSFSGSDKNLYSELDSYDNRGSAFKLDFQSFERPLSSSLYKLSTGVNLEYLDKYFTSIDRFRPIEFDRDWTYVPISQTANVSDTYLHTWINLEKDPHNILSYSFSRRNKGEQVNGYQQSIMLNKEIGKFRLNSDLFLLNNDQFLAKSIWERVNADLSYDLNKINFGYKIAINHNRISEGDSLLGSANYYNEHMFFLRSSQNVSNTFFNLGFGLRQDYIPSGGILVDATYAKTLNLSFDHSFSKSQKVKLGFIYRSIDDRILNDPYEAQNSLAGRLDWSGSIFNNSITNELTFSVANSRELRKEYIFIQVPIGEGNYNWIDGNNDGIQDLNEFFLAVHFDERNYVKIYIPTSEYVEAFENTINYRFNLRFPLSWKNSGGGKGFLYKISNTTVWTATTKILDESLKYRLLAFAIPLKEMDLLGLQENFRTSWFFNRTNPRYGMNLTYKLNHFVNLLAGGMDERKINSWDFVGRINLNRFYTVRFKGNMGTENSFSEFLLDRDYIIDFRKLTPSIAWQPFPNLRFDMFYGYTSRRNVQNIESGESASIYEIGSEFRLSKVTKSNIRGEVSYARVNFKGSENSPVGYAVLAGLKPGSNINWQVSLQQTLIEGLQLSVNYQGRKSDNSKIIHVGRIMVNALF